MVFRCDLLVSFITTCMQSRLVSARGVQSFKQDNDVAQTGSFRALCGNTWVVLGKPQWARGDSHIECSRLFLRLDCV